MIIQLKNFGPIEHFEFDTDKDMHFIFGENNIGKSYAISAVYLILKNWKMTAEYPNFDVLQHEILQNKLKVLNSSIDISEEITNFSKRHLNTHFLPNLENSLKNSFTSIAELFNQNAQKSFEIDILTELYQIKIEQKKNRLQLNIIFDYKWIAKQSEENNRIYELEVIHKSLNQSAIAFLRIDNKFELEKRAYVFVIEAIFNKKYILSAIYFLPASRSGLYNSLNGLSNIIVQVTQLRNQIPNLKFDLPNLTEPIADYFFNISNIKTKGYGNSFSQFAKQLEDNIIKGKINFDKSNKKLFYEPFKVALSLELSQVSSMISEIAPIIAHLKFIFDEDEINKGDKYIFIEEPEAHLHPKIQVELIKLFAEMAKKGLKIVMTSHSNYMFNKLSNMILAKEIDPNTISVAHMKMGEKGSYVDTNSMHVDETGIEDNNFADVAEELYMERLKLYEQTH
jgi:predicted ATPase